MEPITIVTPPGAIQPIGIIQFVHGMCEHRHRYKRVLDYFSKKGFICAIRDMPGHGDSVTKDEDLGYFGENGDKTVVENVHELNVYLKREYPGLPVILIGHSMGSLVARAYTKKYDDEIDLLILSGSPSNNSAAGAGKVLVRIMALFNGWRYRSPFIQNMVMGSFEKAFESEGIVNSWLSSDCGVATLYNKDPKCGFTFTLNGFYTLLTLIKTVYNEDGWALNNPNLRIAFFSGAEDPCRINDKKFKAAVETMRHAGYNNTTGELIPGMRHEIFNEMKYLDVFKKIEDVINDTLNK